MNSNFHEFMNNKDTEGNSMAMEGGSEIYCICRSSNINTFMISCDFCQEWFHGKCVGIRESVANNIDLYYCKSCKKSNPNLKTTYKTNQRKIKNRKRTKRKRMQNIDILEEIDIISTGNTNLPELGENNDASTECQGADKTNEKTDFGVNHIDYQRIMNDAELASIFEMDTTRRKAKTIANENLKQQQNEKFEEKVKIKSKRKVSPLRQCYGPECVMAARSNSKYCSDECGLRLGRNRILEILPARIEQRKILPCAADELSRNKLSNVRQQQKNIHKNLEQIDVKIMQLLQLVQKSRTSREDRIVLDDPEEEHLTLDCKLCGAEIGTRLIVKHLESCYKKQERRLLLTGTTAKPDDEEWNIFCNHKMGRQGYCKQLRVLCPFHYKDSRDEEDLCGYPLQMDLRRCEGKFCGRSSKNCTTHPSSWEDIFRAELDMEKLQLLLKLSELERQEMQLRQEMAARGNVMALMLHSTIVH
ncbi:CXXC-type zinc finger protein 1 [Trichonephila clavata]|uniref:CXXC-type zinc finger protein 1 n=1 Tax=Trichonephila clavata TaxID=2740835 RepID=A0A8X6FTE9_TRICU|nr:CXXC-type zinc finger protein 1 [Trichonephila clavata]